ncbi:hypothetical protein RQM59_01675 [Flavobacteriaceae bacterium S356]|uniref:Pathogenicity island protein n=1 Tax=Asprobacillus argus TaxID=3076534 RepID=A0ABU3LBG2_9FLAO|nr:hypothetical protein [Flavobacteriaceae bacterium S356]
MSKYREIEALNEIYVKHKVEIRFSTTDFLVDSKEYRAVTFKLGGKTFNFYVEDELDDLRYNYPLLNLCLVLRELEGYAYAQDYLVWCQERYLDPKNENILANYRNLATIYREVEEIMGNIDSQISDWDFEMGSGASWELRKKG